jgi:hypothetical protein
MKNYFLKVIKVFKNIDKIHNDELLIIASLCINTVNKNADTNITIEFNKKGNNNE